MQPVQSGILMGGGPRPQFEVLTEHSQLETLLEGRQVSLEQVTEAAADISDVLSAILDDASEVEFAEVRSDPSRWGDDEREDPEIASRKYRLVLGSFDLADLRRRYWVKVTSKNDLPGRLEWEVSLKQADDSAPSYDEQGVAFATVRLSTRPDYRAFLEPEKELVLTLDAEGRRLHDQLT